MKVVPQLLQMATEGRFKSTLEEQLMAADDSSGSAGHDPIESLIDDLIRDIYTESGQPAKTTRARSGDTMAGLIESAILSGPSAAASRQSMIEKVLLAQAVASALAEALAPALADALTPEIMKALEHYTADDGPGEKAGSAATTGQSQQKKDVK